jgi:hypothetical protein
MAEVRTRIDDASAWCGNDFASPDAFTYQCDASQRAELLNCCVAIESRGDGFEATSIDDFRLPSWQPLFAELNQQLRAGRGFGLLRGLPFDGWSKQRCRLATWGIGLHFGKHVSQTIEGQRICDVMDVTRGEASPRQFKTNRELSLHTDPVSDMIGLACLRAAMSGGDSVLTSATTVYNQMLERDADLLEALFEGFHVHRYGEGRPEDPAVTDYLVPVFAMSNGQLDCRYVRPTIVAGHEALGLALTERQIAAMDLFDAIAAAPENQVTFRLAQGDLVLVNNLCVLHARHRFVDAEQPDEMRHLLRLWLEAPKGFRSVPAEMNYFNGGRCGIPIQAGRSSTFDIRPFEAVKGMRATAPSN